MKTNGNSKVLAQIARRGLLVAAVLAMVLSVATMSRAQSSATTAPDQNLKTVAPPPAVAQTPTAVSAPTVIHAEAPAPQAEKPPAKGQHEGITVHGYWIIDIQNPDGKVTTHREFENSLIGTEIAPDLIFGMMTPLGWMVQLDGGTGAQSSSPCGTVRCFLFESSPGSAKYISTGAGGDCGAGPNCPTVLTRTPALGALVPGGSPIVSLQATFPAPSAGYVGNVATNLVGCISSAATTSNTPGLSPISPADCTAGNYPTSGVDFFRAVFTGTAVSPVIQVASGQTVSVTVQLSFH